MSKRIKLAFFMILLVGMLAFTAINASAATTPATRASIVVSVYQDNGGTSLSNFQGTYGISSGAVSVKNSAGETLDQSLDYLISISSNVVTISNIPFADTYYVSFSSYAGGQTATAIVNAKISNTPTKTKLIWSAKNNYTPAKSGVIAGNTVDASGAVLAGVTVKAYNKNTIYETTSAATTGAYKLFVPAGAYTLVIVGKDTTTDYANISVPIKVVAGQAAGPMLDLSGQTPWSSMSYNSQIGLTGLTISGSSKTVTGTAYKDTIVSIYEYNCSKNGNTADIGGGEIGYPILYAFVGSKKVTATGTATSGTFSITLPEYPAGKKYAVQVVDSNLNSSIPYNNDGSYFSATVPKITAALGSDPAATIVTPNTITVTEPTGVTSGNFNSNITSVAVATYGGSPITLSPSQYSIATKGKLIINKGVLKTATTYTITVSATGYNAASVTQIVGASTTIPPNTLTGFTVKTGGGTVSGSAQFSAIGTAGSGNKLVYVVSNQSTIQVKLGNTLTGYTALNAATDITGVTATSTKYIHVYEISSADAVVKAKVFTLTAALIKP